MFELIEWLLIIYRDKSGSISAKEMKSVFKALGMKATDAEIRGVVRDMDIDGK